MNNDKGMTELHWQRLAAAERERMAARRAMGFGICGCAAFEEAHSGIVCVCTHTRAAHESGECVGIRPVTKG